MLLAYHEVRTSPAPTVARGDRVRAAVREAATLAEMRTNPGAHRGALDYWGLS